MSLTTVETAIQGIAARIAALTQQYVTIAASGTSFWARVDAAADETFENRLKGADTTEFDSRINNGEFAVDAAKVFLGYLNEYATTDLSLAGFDAYLTEKRWRVPQEFADWWYQYWGAPLSAANIIPQVDADRCGSFAYGASYVAGSDFATTVRGYGNATTELAGRLQATVPTGVTIGASSWTIDVTAKFEADATESTFTETIAITDSSPAGTTFQIGKQSPSVDLAAGDTTIAVSDTTPFSVDGRILISDDNAHEVATVQSISTNTSITIASGVRHAYTTANNLAVQPLLVGISTVATNSGGASGDQVEFGVNPDYANAL